MLYTYLYYFNVLYEIIEDRCKINVKCYIKINKVTF